MWIWSAVIRQVAAPSHPSGFQEIVDGILIIMLSTIGGYAVRKFKKWDSAYEVLATRKPTELEPNPPKGIVDQTQANTAATGENTNAVLAMSTRMAQSNGTMKDILNVLADHSKLLATLLGGTATLIADTQPNDGSTSRDMLDEIVSEQQRVKTELEDNK